MKKLVCDITDELYKELKHEAIDEDTTLKKIVTKRLQMRRFKD